MAKLKKFLLKHVVAYCIVCLIQTIFCFYLFSLNETNYVSFIAAAILGLSLLLYLYTRAIGTPFEKMFMQKRSVTKWIKNDSPLLEDSDKRKKEKVLDIFLNCSFVGEALFVATIIIYIVSCL